MRGIRSRTKVVLDRKERLDIVRDNRRLGGDIDLEGRGSPRRFRQIYLSRVAGTGAIQA
jgi:hypothetical protein